MLIMECILCLEVTIIATKHDAQLNIKVGGGRDNKGVAKVLCIINKM